MNESTNEEIKNAESIAGIMSHAEINKKLRAVWNTPATCDTASQLAKQFGL